MTNQSIDAASIVVPTSKPMPTVAVQNVCQSKTSVADIVVPAFTPAPLQPKATKPVRAKTSSGGWPVSAETLLAIMGDVDAEGPDANDVVRAYILIGACIERGIDAGTHIRRVAIELGFNVKQIDTLRHVPNTPWQKGPDGRYRLI